MYYFIVNPSSQTGLGAKIWNDIKPILAANKVEYRVYKTTPDRNATVIVSTLLKKISGEVKIIILGGDGSINDALQGIPESDFERVIMGYLPTGSSNDLARALGYSKDAKENLLHLINSNAYKKMDLGLLKYNKAETLGYTKRYFIVSCGIGFDANVCHEVNTSSFKKLLNSFGLGKLSYLLICIKQLLGIPFARFNVLIDDNKELSIDKAYFFSVLNHCYQGGGIKFCPDAIDCDGILDICYAHRLPRLKVLTVLPLAFFGKHVGKKGIGIDRCSTVNIKCDSPLWIHTDGEVNTMATDVTITCMPGKLNFIV